MPAAKCEGSGARIRMDDLVIPGVAHCPICQHMTAVTTSLIVVDHDAPGAPPQTGVDTPGLTP